MSKIDGKACKTMVVLAIEHTLLKTSINTLEKVQTELHQEFNCDISECYEHPEYLTKVLKDLQSVVQHEIVENVNRYLDEFSYQEQIAEFLDKIKQP
ncbi:MAG TPA: hypothetical protein VJ571_06495 [Candidatus Nitrosotalea sp.]|nr:hypothetical protein [Candidatus Nitrosotalea sp.]